MQTVKHLQIHNIIKRLSENIVKFQYVDFCFKEFDKYKIKQYNIYNDVLLSTLARILLMRNYKKPMRVRINSLNEMNTMSSNFLDCIITAKFQLRDLQGYLCFFTPEEMQEEKSCFTNDFLEKLIDSKNLSFNKIFQLFVPVEILYFEHVPQMDKEFCGGMLSCLESVSQNEELLETKLSNALDHFIENFPLQARVYISQLLCLDYRDTLFNITNKLISDNKKIFKIKNTIIEYY